MKAPEPFLIVCLCTGNICRSPMAEGILAHALRNTRARVVSAGVAAPWGVPASENSVIACAEIGIDISGHRSQPLTPELAARADLILAMEMHHLFAARSLAPQHAEKMHLLSQYAEGDARSAPLGVSDPIGGNLDEYRATRDVISSLLAQAQPRVAREIQSQALEF